MQEMAGKAKFITGKSPTVTVLPDELEQPESGSV